MPMATRPPPPSGRPPAYAIASRTFGRANLRPIVIGSTVAAIIWSLVWSAGAFQDMGGDKQNNDLKKLVAFDIVLGSLYAGVAAIEFFGLFAAITRRTPMARIFVGLSLLVVAMVGSAELVRTIVHFVFKSSIIDECTLESTGKTTGTSFGFWGSSTRTLSQNDAEQFCNSSYTRTTYSTILWLIVAVLTALFFASIAYSFYRQLLDPNSFRAPRAPSDQVRLDALRQQQPYGGGYVPYPGFGGYQPPAGPPPGFSANAPPYEGGRLPGYGSEFPAKDVGDEKEGEIKGGDPFTDTHHTRLGAGPSEAELGTGYRV